MRVCTFRADGKVGHKMSRFEELMGVNVNPFTEKKKQSGTELTYLSWPYAWAEVKKRCQDASYTVWKDDKGLPYTFDPNTGYMVYTSVTIDGITHEMWLPVMDGANKAMKAEPYTYKAKFGEKTVEAATMFDINKTIMRCLVKNLGMFGLGLYIYAGEDLPITEEKTEAKTGIEAIKMPVMIDGNMQKTLANSLKVHGKTASQLEALKGIGAWNQITVDMFNKAMKELGEE